MKIIFACLMLIGFNLSAQEWEPYWVEAIKDCYAGDYNSAEFHFDQTIDWMEHEKDLNHPSIYMDRARVYMVLNKYEQALADVNKALLSEKLQISEQVKAVSVRIAARIKLGFSDGYEDDMNFLFKNVKIPVEAVNPYCPCAINIYKQPILTVRALTIESCRLWCDDSAQAAIIGWCAFFPDFCTVNACNQAVLEIQGNCRNCCGTFLSQDICAAPFADIVAVMQKYLPPCGCPR